MHLRLTRILRVDARSATAQENTSHVTTCPRMAAELVVPFADPRSFWYSGAAASLLLDGGICSVIEHQQNQLMCQQEVIDEAGAARTPVPQYAQGKEENQLTSGLENEPETLAVDEELSAELADAEANPLGEFFLPGMNDARKKRVEQLAFMLMMHTKNRAIQMITRLSDPVNGLEIWRRFREEWEPVNRGNALTASRGQALEECECPVRQYEAQNVDTLRDTLKAALLARNPQDSQWCRCVRLSATRL